MNNQKPEPRIKGDGSTLDFHSIFFTIQGEGPFAGHRAIFVRLAGCNLQCPGCDTEYTEGRQTLSADAITQNVIDLAEFNDARGCLVVITGGEPLRQNIGKLVSKIATRGHIIQIESNGVFAPDDVTERWLWHGRARLVVSPKTTKIHEKCRKLAVAFKYVLDEHSVNPNDGLPIKALSHPASTGVARPPQGKLVIVNPFDAGDAVQNKRNLEAAARSCMTHGYILGVQLHKLLGLE